MHLTDLTYSCLAVPSQIRRVPEATDFPLLLPCVGYKINCRQESTKIILEALTEAAGESQASSAANLAKGEGADLKIKQYVRTR